MTSFNQQHNKNVIALGMFDGMHLGHKKVIMQAKKVAAEINGKVFVVTFDTHPRQIFSSKHEDYLLTTNPEKLSILENFNIDGVVFLYFDQKTANMNAENFIKKDLIAKLNPHTVVVGKDFRFAKDQEGDVNFMKKFVNVEAVSEIKKDGDKISSTHIRASIENGDLYFANKLLGYNYFMQNQVIHGLGLASKFDVPTANIHIPQFKLLPQGVFLGYTNVDGKAYLSAVSIGMRKTMNQAKPKLCCETHLIDFEGNIYHKNVKVQLVKKIREQQHFKSLDLLFKQVKKDIAKIKQL
jgi:riboflavin kinase/FMN adenylyltransferase